MFHRLVAVAAVCVFFAGCSDSTEVCGDGEDNDYDAAIDCEDSDCGAGSECGPSGLTCAPSGTCSQCSGNGGAAEPTREASCGDGFDNDCDGAVDCADSDCEGPACGGVDPGPGATGTIGHFRLAQTEHAVLGALGSGFREQSLLVFEVLRIDGTPFAGLRVNFEHDAQGGSFIGATASCTGTHPAVCTAQGTTDASGKVAVLLHSGRRFAVLSVRAEATTAGVTREVVAGGFTVVGAKPTGARFSVDCRPYNVPALTVTDCLYSRYAGEDRNVDCTATLGDRHGNLVAIPTLVSFQAEAGEIVPAASTPEYVPASSNGLGQAIGILDVYGAPLPWDVEPLPNEQSATVDYGCGTRITNPRDGLVTVIAMVEGEEGFVDGSNDCPADGRYQGPNNTVCLGIGATRGENFIDLGEPYVDVDDDGVRGPDEWFLDRDEDGAYTGPNGVWDEDTVLWTQTRVAYTGHPYFHRDGAGHELFTRLYDAGSPPDATLAAAPFTVFVGPPPTTQIYGAFFTDRHLNPLGSSSTFGAEALAGNVSASLSAPTATADQLPTSFRMLYCDQPTAPATCRDGPADQACVTSPCYLTTEVGKSFLYGNYAYLAITGTTPGADVVQVWAAVEDVASVFEISGVCLP